MNHRFHRHLSTYGIRLLALGVLLLSQLAHVGSAAVATEPEFATSREVIKIQRPAVGKLDFKNLVGRVHIIDTETGEVRANFCNGCGSNTQVPAGTYNLKFKNFTVRGVEVGPGETRVFDLNTVAGRMDFKNLVGRVHIIDTETGEERANFCNGCGSNTQVPAGTYKLKFPNFAIEDGVEVGLGETRVFDVSTVAGRMDFKNLVGRVHIIDTETGEERANFCNGCGSNTQVPAGTYKLKFPNFAIEDGVEVGLGETRVFDVSTVAGRMDFKNLVGRVHIIDTETGEERASFCNGCGSNTQVPAGTYKLKFPNFAIEDGVEVGLGETRVFDVNKVAGALEFKSHEAGRVYIIDQETGEERANYCKGCGSNTQVPAGTYRLKFPNFTVEDIMIEAGQTVVIE